MSGPFLAGRRARSCLKGEDRVIQCLGTDDARYEHSSIHAKEKTNRSETNVYSRSPGNCDKVYRKRGYTKYRWIVTWCGHVPLFSSCSPSFVSCVCCSFVAHVQSCLRPETENNRELSDHGYNFGLLSFNAVTRAWLRGRSFIALCWFNFGSFLLSAGEPTFEVCCIYFRFDYFNNSVP